MDIFNFDPALMLSFLLTFIRVSIIIFMLPVIGTEGLPNQWKAYVCLIFTMAIWPVIQLPGVSMPAHPLGIVLLILGEVVLGLVLATAIRFFFSGLQAGGELVAMQMGFSMINFADPSTGSQTGIIAHMLYTVSVLIFLAFDGHLYMLRAFVDTFQYIPAGSPLINDTLLRQMLRLSNSLFTLAVKIIGPVMVTIFMVELSLALMSRASPQMRIMEMGFPLKIATGFFIVTMIFELLAEDVYQYILGLDDLLFNLIRSMSPRFAL